MKISVSLPAMAPQPTGHPASLPADPVQASAVQQVTAASAGAGSGNTQSEDHSGSQDQSSVPPTAIQIKIMELLDQQAREMKPTET